MYEELVKILREQVECDKELYPQGAPFETLLLFLAADAIEELSDRNVGKWIPVTKGLPECEQEVLICTEKKLVGRDAYIDSIVTPAIYEDGTMRENDSIWHWVDIDWAGWDEEEDCGIIPEGWWENRHFNSDGVYNNPVDRKVVAWMALPKSYDPPKEE